MTSTNSNTEKELLQQVAKGDERAFNTLFNLYWDRLYQYLLRISKSHEAAEEIAIDVFMKLWAGKALLPGIRNLDVFLFRVAHNKTMDFFRLAARDVRLQELLNKQTTQQDNPTRADYPLLNEEAQKVLNELIAELSPQRRLIFSMSRIEGLNHKEIAQRLNLSRQTVKNTMSEALNILQSSLRKKHPDTYMAILILLNL